MGGKTTPAPVEYAVAVDLYLGQAALSAASRRVYRISLAGWAWPLVGKPVPAGQQRRSAAPPVVPLAVLDVPGAGARLAAALADRGAVTDARTVNRELSTLRGAIGWWREQGWIENDPVAGLRHTRPDALAAPLSMEQVTQLLRLPATLREHAFWRLLYDSGAHVDEVLGLDAWRLDLVHGTAPASRQPRGSHWIRWRASTGELLGLLLAGRSAGPVFLTDRKAPARAARADVCPFTGRARMSYRRAAEIFGAATRPLDPAGRGWTLGQLRQAGLEARSG